MDGAVLWVIGQRGLARTLLLPVILAALSGSVLPTPAAAQTDDERAVIAAAQAMFDAMEARDPDAFRDAMVPEGALMTVGFETMGRTSRDEFASRLADVTYVMSERMWDPEVRIDGAVATLWTAYDFYRGIEFSHCGTDAFQLVSTPDGWKVLMVSYTVQMPPDCSTHPDGPPGGE